MFNFPTVSVTSEEGLNKSNDSPPHSPSDNSKDFQLVIGEQSSSNALEIDESSTDEAVFSDEDDEEKQAPPPPPPPPATTPPGTTNEKKKKVH